MKVIVSRVCWNTYTVTDEHGQWIDEYDDIDNLEVIYPNGDKKEIPAHMVSSTHFFSEGDSIEIEEVMNENGESCS